MADCILVGNGKRINSGGTGNYVSDGLILMDTNPFGLSQKSETFPALTLSDCTIEICYSAQSTTQPVGRLLNFLGETFCLNTGFLGTDSDYGLQIFYGAEYGAYAGITIDGLTLGNSKHTYTVEQSGARTNVYFDGVLVGGYDNAGGRTTISGGFIYYLGVEYPVTGTWYNMRVYNRALTAAEILANHNEDVNQYGS